MITTPKRKALVYMAAIFAAGLLAGGVVGGLSGFRLGTQRLARPLPADQMAATVKQRLQQELHLTAEQQKLIAPMVDSFVLEMNEVHSNTVERAVGVIQHMHQRVAEVLTPEQGERLLQVQTEREAEFRHAAHPPGR
jgi:hypothetical protein